MRRTSIPFQPREEHPSAANAAPPEPYGSSLEHLRAELERIELLVRLQVLRARQVTGDDAFRGLSISEQDLDELLTRSPGRPHWSRASAHPTFDALQAEVEQREKVLEQRRAESERRGVPLRLAALEARCQLARFDVDVLLLGLAAELDSRYERLFGYLHDDITRKRPGVDVALGLFCPTLESRFSARERFAPGAPLRRHGLVHLFTDPAQVHPTLLACAFKVDERIVDYLHGSDAPDARLAAHVRVVTPRGGLEDLRSSATLSARLGALVEAGGLLAGEGPVVHLMGPYGVGRRSAAEALCGALGRRLLRVNGQSLETLPDDALEAVARLCLREAALLDAAVCWEGADALLDREKKALRAPLVRALEDGRGLTLLTGESPWQVAGALGGRPFVRLELPSPAQPEREQLWAEALGTGTLAPDADLPLLANRFRLTGGQIRDAAATARTLALLREPGRGQVTMADLSRACRAHASRTLSSLAQKVESPHGWDDLVLARDRTDRLRELCNQARHRGLVLDTWGFGRKLATGRGLAALFTGPPGTGKTMAAGIVAGELGLDLYRIDLSTVVNKYVGETEKQLARVFDEAERCNAVLFFDEADALFGRRSEVRDSHDRYANLEVSYLLQRLEVYEGVVILASNLSRNIDDAFVRRLQFIVDFAFPGEPERRRIWERSWPSGVPRGQDVDLDLLARRFELAGGHLRNIALAAAYLAAAEGAAVGQRHLLHAARREYQKLGKMADEALFAPERGSGR